MTRATRTWVSDSMTKNSLIKGCSFINFNQIGDFWNTLLQDETKNSPNRLITPAFMNGYDPLLGQSAAEWAN
jgi:hypothetical protein